MGSALTIGLVSGGLSALSTFGGAMAQGQQQRNQAAAMEAQAAQTRAQAQVEAQKGAIETETLDRQKSKIRREFNELQGRNRASLGAGNIDMTSGSAMDVSLGNINSFAEDMGENRYQMLLKQWETDQNVKTMNWQADQYDANSSYLKRTADNFGTSLLKAALGGAASGLGSYAMAGGTFGGLFGSGADTVIKGGGGGGFAKTAASMIRQGNALPGPIKPASGFANVAKQFIFPR